MIADRRNFLQKIGLSSVFVYTGIASVKSYPLKKQLTKNPSNILDEYSFFKGNKDIFSYGAKGDGRTVDTEAIQAAIDSCYEEGGGMVYFQKGCFISGTIYLKSNVTLYLEAGATLKASNNLADFPIIPSKYSSKYPYKPDGARVTFDTIKLYKNNQDKGFVTHKALIYAEDQQNIFIIGRGTIDGNWYHWKDEPWENISFWERPQIIQFRGCKNIHIQGITLRNVGTWVQLYRSCSNIIIEGITVDSRANPDIEKPRFADYPGTNMDGLSLTDCKNVRISNCFINSGDDGIVLKSFSPDEYCQDIVISNCVVSSNASGIKIGTETSGGFRDIIVQNCVVYDTRCDALSIMTVDGARIERINFSNVSIRNIKGTAIFIRLGTRNRINKYNAKINTPHLKDIMIENILGTGIESEYGCSITGTSNYKVENICLRNINLHFVGDGKLEDAFITVPENEKEYPYGKMFGRLPTYGFFIRHAKNIALENIQVDFGREDFRPALFFDDVDQLDIKGFKAPGTLNTPELIRLVNTQDVLISDSRPTSVISVFLTVYGDRSNKIILQNNVLRDAKQKYFFKKGSTKNILTEFGNIE